MKNVNLSEDQISLLSEIIDTAIDALTEFKDDEKGVLPKEEQEELDELYAILYELSYGHLEKTT